MNPLETTTIEQARNSKSFREGTVVYDSEAHGNMGRVEGYVTFVTTDGGEVGVYVVQDNDEQRFIPFHRLSDIRYGETDRHR